jgi:hypothetical protein
MTEAIPSAIGKIAQSIKMNVGMIAIIPIMPRAREAMAKTMLA